MLAESFSTIVGLLGQYRSERGDQDQLEYNDFMEWLAKANHAELKKAIELNTQTTTYIKAILNQDHQEFKEKLNKIDSAITAFASAIEGFAPLARTMHPDAILSDQAVSILKQIEESGSTKVHEIHLHDGVHYIFTEANGSVSINEPRFAEDDFSTLVELGLLRRDFSSNGENLYIFTRAAHALIGELNS